MAASKPRTRCAAHNPWHRLALATLTLALLALPRVARAADAPPLTLLFVGDVSFAGRPAPTSNEAAAGVANPLRHFADRFRNADAVFANAEGLLTAERPPAYRASRLDIGASPVWAGAFAAAGVSAVGLANNHVWDAGAPGVLEQRATLAATGVVALGAGASADEAEAPWLLERDGRCVAVLVATLKSNRPPRPGAFVAYYPGADGLARLAAQVRALRARDCFVIVSLHAGREAVPTPPRAVVDAATQLAEAGAGLIVGHHPHVLQGVGWRGDTAIAFSLGNFVFTNRAPEKRDTGVLCVTLTAESPPRLAELALWPAVIGLPDFTPRPATAAERRRIADHLTALDAKLGTTTVLDAERIVFRPGPGR